MRFRFAREKRGHSVDYSDRSSKIKGWIVESKVLQKIVRAIVKDGFDWRTAVKRRWRGITTSGVLFLSALSTKPEICRLASFSSNRSTRRLVTKESNVHSLHSTSSLAKKNPAHKLILEPGVL
jgi:hypothetical protein